MKILALDLSKSCTGWAYWEDGYEHAVLGHFACGGAYSSRGDCYAKLQSELNALHIALGFDRMVWEQKISPQNLGGITNYETIALMGGLEAHAESFAAVFRIPCRAVNVSSWRPDFLGRDEIAGLRAKVKEREKAEGKKIGMSDVFKIATMERARQFGHAPRKPDEADALGVLDYELLTRGITPPWRLYEVLQPMVAAR
jgi:hypothetical protein